MSTFVSIFNDPTFNQLYHDAVRLPEHASTTLMSHWLSKGVFHESHFVVATEKPTREHHDRSRLDIIVQTLLLDPTYVDIKSRFLANTWVFWLTGEGKEPNAGREDIRYAEEQAYMKTWNYLHENRRAVSSCWVLTYFGPRARLWACNYDGPGMLEGFCPYRGDNGESSAYLDIRHYEETFNLAWTYIKQNLQPDPDFFYAFWNPTEISAEPPAASGSALPVVEIDDSPNVIYSKNYAQVEVLRITQDDKTEVTHNNRQLQFPRRLWRRVKVVFESNELDGFFMDDLQIWTWTLEPRKEQRQSKGKSKVAPVTSDHPKRGKSKK